MNIFHLAIPTHDITLAKKFYSGALNAAVGREYESYVIFNFFGHQLVTHLKPEQIDTETSMYPRHYGIIFPDRNNFEAVYQSAKKTTVFLFLKICLSAIKINQDGT